KKEIEKLKEKIKVVEFSGKNKAESIRKDFDTKIKALEKKQLMLFDENEGLSNKLTEVEKDDGVLKKELKSTREELRLTKDVLYKAEGNLAEEKRSFLEMSSLSKKSDEVNKKLGQQKEFLIEELDVAKKENVRLEEEQRLITDELEYAKVSMSEAMDKTKVIFKGETVALNEKIERLITENNIVTDKLKTSERGSALLNKKLGETRSELGSSKNILTGTQDTIVDLNKALEISKDMMRSLKKEKDKYVNDFENSLKKRKKLQDDITVLNEKLRKEKRSISGKIEKVKIKFEKEIKNSGERYGALLNSKSVVKDLLGESDNRIVLLKSELKDVKENLASIRNVLGEKEAYLRDMSKDIKEKDSVIDEVTCEKDGLEKDLETLRKEKGILENKVALLEKSWEDTRTAATEDLDKAKKTLQDSMNAAENKYERLLNEKKVYMGDMSKDIEEKDSIIDEVTREKDGLKKDLAILRSEKDTLENKILLLEKSWEDTSTAATEDLNEAKKTLQDSMNAAENKYERLLDEKKAHMGDMSKDIKEKGFIIDEVTREKDGLKKDLAILRSEKDTLENKILLLERDSEYTKTAATEDLDEAKKTLQDSMNAAENKYERLLNEKKVYMRDMSKGIEEKDFIIDEVTR
ncbi:MAG: hypothetical protein KAI70_02205, partial [Candidatus Omnitrophica bacterium]|nr:hypothetical protein [Candidatus Omnitrophota bacterium]